MKNTIFKLTEEKTLDSLASFIKHHLIQNENMDAQILKDENGIFLIQSRVNDAGIRKLVGMDCTTNIRLTPVGDSVVLDFSKGTWFDKCVAGTIAFFWSWPLAITTAIGVYKQGTLSGKVLKAVEKFMK